jgi:hypothetical protein
VIEFTLKVLRDQGERPNRLTRKEWKQISEAIEVAGVVDRHLAEEALIWSEAVGAKKIDITNPKAKKYQTELQHLASPFWFLDREHFEELNTGDASQTLEATLKIKKVRDYIREHFADIIQEVEDRKIQELFDKAAQESMLEDALLFSQRIIDAATKSHSNKPSQ